MASNNETVADIVREMFEYPKSWGEYNHLDWKALAKRIQEAHDHELDVQYGRISRLIDKHAAKDDERLTVVAIYENVIADKDREIAELRECLKEAIREKCPFTRMSCKHGEQCDYECGTEKWRNALKGSNNATGDDDISKDAEIAELRERIKIAEDALEEEGNAK